VVSPNLPTCIIRQPCHSFCDIRHRIALSRLDFHRRVAMLRLALLEAVDCHKRRPHQPTKVTVINPP